MNKATKSQLSVGQVAVVAALVAAEKHLGPNRDWDGDGPQLDFVQDTFQVRRHEIGSIPELTTKTVVKPDGSITAFGKMDIRLQWKVTGRQVSIGKYVGAELPVSTVKFYTVAGHSHPVVQIQTSDTNDVVLITPHDPIAEKDLMRVALRFVEGLRRDTASDSAVRFPKIDTRRLSKLNHLIGMHTMGDDGKPAIVTDAQEMVLFQMDHEGARVGTKAKVEMARGATPKPFVIDEPCLVVHLRFSISKPIFAGYIAEDAWLESSGPEDADDFDGSTNRPRSSHRLRDGAPARRNVTRSA